MSNPPSIFPSIPSSIWKAKPSTLPELSSLIHWIEQPALVWEKGKNAILLANSALMRLTAYSQKELVGHSLSLLIGDASPTELLEVGSGSIDLLRRNRYPLPVVVQARPLDGTGNWVVFTFTLFDQTPEEKNRRQERFFQAMQKVVGLLQEDDAQTLFQRIQEIVGPLIEARYVWVYQVDTASPCLKCVMKTEEAPDLADQIPSSDLAKLSTPFLWTPGKKVNSEIQKAGRIANLSFLATTPLGQDQQWFGLLVVGDLDNEPNPHMADRLKVLGGQVSAAFQHMILTDTLRRELETQRRKIAVYQNVSDGLKEGVILIAPDLTILEINSAAEWLLGYAGREVIGQHIESVLIGPERLMAALEAAMDGIPLLNLGSQKILQRDGNTFPAHLSTQPLQKDGVLLGIALIFQNESENEQMRAQTQQLEQRAVLGEMMAVFAHEVRNPINNIVSGVQILLDECAPDDPNLEMLNRMVSDCNRLNHHMESLLAYSRQGELHLEVMDLKPFLKRMLDRWYPRMAKVSIKHHLQVDADLPPIIGDQRALEQVMINLITNAIEAMSAEGGTLAVKAIQSKAVSGAPQIELTISDTGPGIPEEVLARMFEPFVTTKSRGTGLGLAITRRIVLAHHGSIQARSIPGGTTFEIILPATQGDAE